MKPGRYATSRQKACQPCSTAKAKCDRRTGSCSRCARRGLSCVYTQPPTAENAESSAVLDSETDNNERDSTFQPPPPGALASGSDNEVSIADGRYAFGPTIESGQSSTVGGGTASSSSMSISGGFHVGTGRDSRVHSQAAERESLDFSSLGLVCPIDVDGISVRWMNPFIPVPGQTVKSYPPTTLSFVARVLKSYASIAIRGRGVPPFVHSSELSTASPTRPITTCLSLARICDSPLSHNEDVAADVLEREMNNLYERHETYGDTVSLAAFQAYLIYCMILFFHLGRGSDPSLRRAMMALQEIACSSSRRGLVCPAEQQRTRPGWEAWVVAEAKRRTLYTMYLFDSVLSSQDGLPTFLGTELRGLYAPASKALWQAGARPEWETAYNVHLVDWVEEDLRIDELWPIPTDLGEVDVSKRRSRVDRWLENVDEFGTMIYAVTSCTHGG